MLANKYIAKTISIIDKLELKGERVPLLIMSRPGFGKTSTIQKYCELKDYNLISLIASRYSADDILGLQAVKDGELVRLTPSWYNKMIDIMKNGKRTILLLDEISAIDNWLQGPLLDLIFSRSLGEISLPENLFIIAAGNYSDDLNGVFKMTAPLVNRFLILNVRNSDFEIGEFLGDDFKNTDVSSLGEYLGLEEEKSKYNFDFFKKWIDRGSEVQFGKSQYIEDENAGLLGFTSIRSLSYCLKFTEEYFNTYPDNLWVRVVGDTLGLSSKRPGKLMADVIYSNIEEFTNIKKEKKEDFLEVCSRVLTAENPDPKDLFLISKRYKKEADDLTAEEYSKASEIIIKYHL